MTIMDDKSRVLTEIVKIYEGREKDMGCAPLVYADILLLEELLQIPRHDIAKICLEALNE